MAKSTTAAAARLADVEPARWTLEDGAEVRIGEDRVTLHDRCGRLLFRYAHGEAEVEVPEGDLTLRTRTGGIVLEAATDVEIKAGRKLSAQADHLDVATKRTHLATTNASLVARHVATTAERVCHQVEHYELTAKRLIERSRDVFRDATELLQVRAGRVRALVRDTYALRARRTAITSKEDTTIDGKRVLLG